MKTPKRLNEVREWPDDLPFAGSRPKKTVLFLGAGASVGDGIPVQAHLLHRAKQFCSTAHPELDLPDDWDTVRNFLERLSPGADPNEHFLEDCLTFLDKATVNEEVIAGAGPIDAREPRRALLNCIAHVLDACQDGSINDHLPAGDKVNKQPGPPMHELGRWLAEKAASGVRERFVVISTNWDTTLDNGLLAGAQPSRIDYCTYTTPWERYFKWDGESEDAPVRDVPHVWKRPLKRHTVKLLKLHGSINWLWCPTCNRLFVSDRENIGLRGTVRSAPIDSGKRKYRRYCPECCPMGAPKETAPLLREVLISPTMVKKLDMVHLRMVWYNALVELMEADKIVFVGYSAPQADYEARYMISKALSAKPKDREITIVDWRDPDPVMLKKHEVENSLNEKRLRANYTSLLGRAFKDPHFEGVGWLVDQITRRGAF